MVERQSTCKMTLRAWGHLLISCMLFAGVSTAAQSGSADTLHWRPDYKLRWADFQGVPDTNSTGMAGTVSGLTTTKSVYTSDTTLNAEVRAVFYKKESWAKSRWKDSATLNHEQGHFNITEVFARMATDSFRHYRLNKKTVDNDLDKIFNIMVKRKNAMQILYDRETTRPIDDRKQKEWDQKIAAWLRQSKRIK